MLFSTKELKKQIELLNSSVDWLQQHRNEVNKKIYELQRNNLLLLNYLNLERVDVVDKGTIRLEKIPKN